MHVLKPYSKYNFRGIAYLPEPCEHRFRGGLFNERNALVRLRFRPFLVESTVILHSLRLMVRVFTVGGFVVIFVVLSSLLEGELTKVWVAEVRRMVKRDPS